ncbi:MAG: endo-1,4-beta-xylanase [Deltaproteobacteria bacterium]|nr:endo-1,4-beta-xylanase [Deltaproteobacteria bacterium]
MIKIFLFMLLLLLNCNNLLFAQSEEPLGPRLRTIVKNKYANDIIIGATTGSWAFGTDTGVILDREFSYVTPENDFKQSTIHPGPGVWNWAASDAWIQHIVNNSQILRMHCPIGPQCSAWARDDNRTAEELENNLRKFLTAVCKRYNGKTGFEYMDVVNETVVRGAWHTNKPGVTWECPWYKIGLDENNIPLYIKIAFEIAQQYAPNLKFIYNHHESNPDSWKLIIKTIKHLRDSGLRVDGIGWQAHINNGWATTENLNELRALIDLAHNNDLEFHITEASVWLKDGNSQENLQKQKLKALVNWAHKNNFKLHTTKPSDLSKDVNFQEYLQKQADTYYAIMNVLLEKRFTGKVGWNVWYIDDGYGWSTEQYPALFDSNYLPKPAYYAIQRALLNGNETKKTQTYKKKDKIEKARAE